MNTSRIDRMGSKVFLLAVFFLFGHHAIAQSPWFVCDYVNVSNCNGDVPSLFVDLQGFPNTKWYSCEQDRGTLQDTCCGMSQIFGDERFLEFKILLDSAATGFLFELVNVEDDPEWNGLPGGSADRDAPGSPTITSSANTGNFQYRINCDPNWYTAFDVICVDDIPGGWTIHDTLFLMFCMTGANDNLYRIKSLKAEISPAAAATFESCPVDILVNASGLDTGTVTWQSAQDPQYDNYLLHTSGRLSNTILVPAGSPLPPGNPPVLLYDVCGSATANIPSACTADLMVCTTVEVTVEVIGSVVIDYPEYCETDTNQYFPTVTVSPESAYDIIWYDSSGGAGDIIDQGIELTTPVTPYTTVGTKSVAVEHPLYRACSRRIQDFVISLSDDCSTTAFKDPSGLHFVVYPNPFTTTVHFRLDLSTITDTFLSIYDPAGRLVATWREGVLTRTFKWEASGLSSGLYFYLLRSGEHSVAGRLLRL